MQDDRTDAVGSDQPAVAGLDVLPDPVVGGEPATLGSGADPPAAADRPMGPVLSIAGAARGLGVAPATLRSWERRYGLAPSVRTAGGHRRYGSEDLARLRMMHRLVRAGVPAAEAARVAINSPVPGQQDGAGPFSALLWGDRPGPEATQSIPALADAGPMVPETDPSAAAGTLPGGPIAGGGLVEVPASGPPATPETPTEAGKLEPGLPEPVDELGLGDQPPPSRPGSAGGGRILSLPRLASASARGLARAAMALDAGSCERIIDSSLDSQGTVRTWEELVRPVMAAIGRRWQSVESGVEIEHTFSVVVAAGLARHAAEPARPRNDSPVLLASAPDEMHDLPLRALQAALAEEGIRTHLLGARTPADALSDAVRRLGPPVVVLWAQMLAGEVPNLPVIRPSPVLIVGGPGLADLPEVAHRADSLQAAIDQIRAALGL